MSQHDLVGYLRQVINSLRLAPADGPRRVQLSVEGYMSIRRASLSTDGNCAVIAGLNGCGKSQFLLALAEKYDQHEEHYTNGPLYWDLGVPSATARLANLRSITMSPAPTRVVYYPPDRSVGGEARRADRTGVWKARFWSDNGDGLSRDVDKRIENIHIRLAAMLAAGSLHASAAVVADPSRIQQAQTASNDFRDRFHRLTDRELVLDLDPEAGARVGVKLPDGGVSDFSAMSSGQKEIAGLLLDITLCQPRTLF